MIKLHENDILWKGYVYFQNPYGDELEIPEPKTLCGYFWIALLGCFFRFATTVSIPQLIFHWGITLSLFVGLMLAMPNDTAFKTDPGWLAFFTIMFLAVWFLISIGHSFYWLLKFMRLFLSDKQLEMMATICLLLLGLGTFVFSFLVWGIEGVAIGIAKIVGIILGCIVMALALSAAIAGICYLCGWLGKQDRISRFFSQVWHMIVALKDRACPLVEVPDSYLKSQETK